MQFDLKKYFKNYTHNRSSIEKKFLDKVVDDSYFLKQTNTKDKYLIDVFKAWGEFVKKIKFPNGQTLPVIWLHQMTQPKLSSNNPKWKNNYLLKMNQVYKKNKIFIDAWMKKHKTHLWKLRETKFEWQAGKDCKDIRQTIITLRQSGIRCKSFKYFPTLVAIVQTTLIFDFVKMQWRHITPRECARLQCFPDSYKLYDEIDKNNNRYYSYKQLGNSLNLEVVKVVEEHLLNYE